MKIPAIRPALPGTGNVRARPKLTLQDAFAAALTAQGSLQYAKDSVGNAEAFIIEARLAGELPAVKHGQSNLRAARRELRLAIIDYQRTTNQLRILDEESDERRRKREAAKARKAARLVEVLA